MNKTGPLRLVLRLALMIGSEAGLAFGDEVERVQRENLAEVGREIFQDVKLSEPVGTSCVSCHVPEAGFADPRGVSIGATGERGTRNAPSLMYAALVPNLDQEDLLREDGVQEWVWQGGLFQDGRARTLHDQVLQPFFQKAEMNLGGEAELALRVRKAVYAVRLRGAATEVEWARDEVVAQRVRRALVEFLKEPMFRPFDARIDDYLRGDQKALSEQEKRGLQVFRGAGKCADCHLLQAAGWPKPLLSDYGYDNLGVPSRGGEKDPGLGGHTRVKMELGMFRAPSLRNIVRTAPYFHNGSVATLREVIEFYNRRDVEPARWGQTDYPETVNHRDLGNLGLTDAEVEDLAALMQAFTDRSLERMVSGKQRFPEAPAGTPDSWMMRAYFPDWNHALPALPPHLPEDSTMMLVAP